MENLKTESNQSIEVNSYSKGILYCVMTSLLLTLIISFVLFSFNFGGNKTFFEALSSFKEALMFFGLIIGLITLVAAIVVGIPTVMILEKQGSLNCNYSGLIGAFSALIVLSIMLKGNLHWHILLFMLYGFACGYAFMYGYKKH